LQVMKGSYSGIYCEKKDTTNSLKTPLLKGLLRQIRRAKRGLDKKVNRVVAEPAGLARGKATGDRKKWQRS